jgi:hypothetical protein
MRDTGTTRKGAIDVHFSFEERRIGGNMLELDDDVFIVQIVFFLSLFTLVLGNTLSFCLICELICRMYRSRFSHSK